jgi:hypothetical protein
MEERECSGGFMSTSLQKAAFSGDAALVEAALECTHTNLDAPNAEGQTALIIAAGRGHVQVARALADAGADLDATDANGHTAWQVATAAGHAAVATVLQAKAAERAAVWSAITGNAGGAGGANGAVSEGVPAKRNEDLLNRLLVEAGLPPGSAECPF